MDTAYPCMRKQRAYETEQNPYRNIGQRPVCDRASCHHCPGRHAIRRTGGKSEVRSRRSHRQIVPCGRTAIETKPVYQTVCDIRWQFAFPKKSKNNWLMIVRFFEKQYKAGVCGGRYDTVTRYNGNLYWWGSAANPIDLSWVEKCLKKQKTD